MKNAKVKKPYELENKDTYTRKELMDYAASIRSNAHAHEKAKKDEKVRKAEKLIEDYWQFLDRTILIAGDKINIYLVNDEKINKEISAENIVEVTENLKRLMFEAMYDALED